MVFDGAVKNWVLRWAIYVFVNCDFVSDDDIVVVAAGCIMIVNEDKFGVACWIGNMNWVL